MTRCKLSLPSTSFLHCYYSDRQLVLNMILVVTSLLHFKVRLARSSLKLQRSAKRRDSRPVLAHRIHKLIISLSFHVFVSGFAVWQGERVVDGQLDTLASLITAPDLGIEKRAECRKTGADDCYVHLYNEPHAGLDIRPW